MHSHSNGRDLPEPPFEFCLAGPYSAAAAAAETHPLRAAPTKSASFGYHRKLPLPDPRPFEFCLRTPPPPPAAKKTKGASSGYQRLPPQRRPPRLGWRALAFGLVRVPAEMEMSDIRERQRRRWRRQRWDSAEEAAVPPPPPPTATAPECGRVGRGPWKLIRSLSCRGFESAPVVATTAPLSFL